MKPAQSKSIYLLITAFYLLAPLTVIADKKTLKPFTAQYRLEKSGLTIAQVMMSLREQNGVWHYKTIAKPKGFAALLSNDKAEQYSQFKIKDQTITPLEYIETRKKEGETKITYQNNSATLTHKLQTTHIQFKQAHYDVQTLQLVIMNDLLQGKAIKKYPIIDHAKTMVYHFDLIGEESVNVNKNNIKATKLSRSKGKRKTVSWHAADYDYLPVQIDQYKNNKLKSSMKLVDHRFQ